MHKIQETKSDDAEQMQSMLQKMDEEYIRLGKNISRLVQEANRRIDSYADDIIALEQKREEHDK